ncbi:hypothetical protein [Actinomadura harenae]|uniref:Uncharacterized protein n=1 Tax=Actinomadura harenae TaxID=2483351 RepID=A0A3M2MBR1_9ACTN|nr:hypothetical protein [Actinomadura harenae]RMI46941.1 hypothetical protein EBO15_04765 [Actinomadura harenae]
MPRGTYLHLEDGTEERFQCAPGPGGWRYVASRTDGTRVDLVVDARWRQLRVEIVAPDWWLRGGATGREVTWVRGGSSAGAAEHSAPASGFLGESPAFLIATAHYIATAHNMAKAQPYAPHPPASGDAIPDPLTPASATVGNAPTPVTSPGAVSSESPPAPSERDVSAFGTDGIAGDSTWLGGEEFSGEEGDVAGHQGRVVGTAADVRLVRVSGFALATLTEAWRWRLASLTRHETDSGPLPVERYEVADLATGEVQHVHLAGDVVLDAPGIELTDLDGPPNLLTT